MNYTIENKITNEEIKELEKYLLSIYPKWKRSAHRIPEILKRRSEEKTLTTLAYFFGITKERIRQQESKGIDIILRNIRNN